MRMLASKDHETHALGLVRNVGEASRRNLDGM